MTIIPHLEKKRITNEKNVAILLGVPSNELFNVNVYVYTIKGEFLWQIGEDLVKRYQTMDDSPFVDIQFDTNQDLVLYNWGGWKLVVNSETGLEKHYEFTK